MLNLWFLCPVQKSSSVEISSSLEYMESIADWDVSTRCATVVLVMMASVVSTSMDCRVVKTSQPYYLFLCQNMGSHL